jgi:hypothetical protein
MVIYPRDENSKKLLEEWNKDRTLKIIFRTLTIVALIISIISIIK